MSVTKVTMDIVLPGRIMFPREVVRKSPKEFTNHTSVWVTYPKYNKETKKKEAVTEQLHVFTRKCIPAHQSLNLSVEAYEYMKSKDSIPARFALSKSRTAEWNALSERERLEFHLNEICHDNHGISYTYEILPD